MTTINTNGYSLVSPEAADEYVKILNNDIEDDWTYKAVHCPNGTGQSFIVAYDKDGIKLGKL